LLSRKVTQAGEMTEYHLEGRTQIFDGLTSEHGDHLFSTGRAHGRGYRHIIQREAASAEPGSDKPTLTDTWQKYLFRWYIILH